MKRQRAHPAVRARALLLFLMMLGIGCRGTDKNLSYVGDATLTDYEDRALMIEGPVDDDMGREPFGFTDRPRTIRDRRRDEIWNMTLAEAIQLALVNNRIARTRGDFLSPGNSLLNNPEGVSSVYDPAIRDSGVLFGARGVESALSAFDAQLTTSMQWTGNSTIQNNPFSAGGLGAGNVLNQDTAAFNSGLSKNLASGGALSLAHTWNYNYSNQPLQLFRSSYAGNVQLSYFQPLWAGAGTEVTRIAGPFNANVQGVSGVNQGVVISRINTDISLVEFEANVRNMIKDVEDVYWDLYLAYRTYDSLVTARNTATETWRVVRAKERTGSAGGGSADEAQALEAYYDSKSRTESALGGPAGRGASSAEAGIYGLELQLRRLCRLPAGDGRVIRPSDEPTVAEFVPEWQYCLVEALTRREELRRQKWNIKSTELQLRAAKNLAHPQLNFVSSYQVNGFGNDLFGKEGPPGTPGAHLQSAYQVLAGADETGWAAGLQFSMPLGLRNALSQVRNLELRLAKAREVLSTQEIEISHEVANSFQLIDHWYVAMSTSYNRLAAAETHLAGVEAEYLADRKALDFLLQAQNRRAAAEASFYRSIVEYNKAITELHYRKGTLLENNNIHLAEGAWTPEAYKDALRRAWARSHAFDAPDTDVPFIGGVEQQPEAFVQEGSQGSVSFVSPVPTMPAQAPVMWDAAAAESSETEWSDFTPKAAPAPVEEEAALSPGPPPVPPVSETVSDTLPQSAGEPEPAAAGAVPGVTRLGGRSRPAVVRVSHETEEPGPRQRGASSRRPFRAPTRPSSVP
jgi:outer membrane protein TolC